MQGTAGHFDYDVATYTASPAPRYVGLVSPYAWGGWWDPWYRGYWYGPGWVSACGSARRYSVHGGGTTNRVASTEDRGEGSIALSPFMFLSGRGAPGGC